MIRALLALILATTLVHAETPLDADAFDATVTGRTLVYGTEAGPYGIEEYLPGRRVRWSFLDGECMDGRWYPQGDAICFAYEGRESPECWRFFRDGARLGARPTGEPDSAPLYVIAESPEPLICRGPRLGV
ncbi:hypothetical protein ACVDG3_14460 [Meridianimarinicoccus sp. RP-17]|uniref:hypothetical protein n=1 Tax=Meridianimarinicoccus zhengii TaxID=2056810 RepID=UPI000DAEA243|nr:hypothetical protein [Phycocomes zhengii]